MKSVAIFLLLLLSMSGSALAEDVKKEDQSTTISVRGGSKNYQVEVDKDGKVKGVEDPTWSKIPKDKHRVRRDTHAEQKRNRNESKRALKEQKAEAKKLKTELK